MTELTPARLVFVGPCLLEGNKPGELWATEEMARAAPDVDALRAASSPFAKGKRSSTVGAIYETSALLSANGKLAQINRDMTYRGMIESEAIAAMSLREKGLQARAAAAKAEAKARKGGPADDLLDQVARIVAKAPLNDQGLILSGFTREIQTRALDLWRKGRRS